MCGILSRALSKSWWKIFFSIEIKILIEKAQLILTFENDDWKYFDISDFLIVPEKVIEIFLAFYKIKIITGS